LVLALHGEAHRPTFSVFAEIIKASPNLTTLELVESGPALPPKHSFQNDTPHSEYTWHEKVTIPSLKSLQIEGPLSSYFIQLLREVLDLPNIQRLEIGVKDDDCSDLGMLLTDPSFTSDNKSILSKLDHLGIVEFWCHGETKDAMLHQFRFISLLFYKADSISS
ncbi:hypothetical protein C8J56DRAFT_793417, partial [Mycena floridula]